MGGGYFNDETRLSLCHRSGYRRQCSRRREREEGVETGRAVGGEGDVPPRGFSDGPSARADRPVHGLPHHPVLARSRLQQNHQKAFPCFPGGRHDRASHRPRRPRCFNSEFSLRFPAVNMEERRGAGKGDRLAAGAPETQGRHLRTFDGRVGCGLVVGHAWRARGHRTHHHFGDTVPRGDEGAGHADQRRSARAPAP